MRINKPINSINMKPKKILIALDYDPTAQKVSEAGYALATALNAEVTLLHVVAQVVHYSSPDMAYLDISAISLNSVEALTLAAQNFLNKTKRHLANPSIQTIIKEGDYADTILEVATEMQATTIVMGSHSHRWLEGVLMGSVTQEVLRNSIIPLYIIPTKKRA